MSTIAGYDLIGDIHGYADPLEKLLEAMGYTFHHGVYHHPERKVIFLGDFIDRGPKIYRVLEIARGMVESENALAVMGNHEFNALAFHTSVNDRAHDSLRCRSIKNIRQHSATLLQLTDSQLADSLEWFRILPMSAEIQGPNGTMCRAVHACWDDKQIQCIADAKANDPKFNDAFLAGATIEKSPLYNAVEIVLKGKELVLPGGKTFRDKEHHERNAIRAKWYAKPSFRTTYQDYALQSDPIDCPIEIDPEECRKISAYPATASPVFVGHYWLKADRPEQLAPNVACLDYSVAKDGFLCGYRWDGEREIDDRKFVWCK
ncbi:MAG: metallophosphoesterase [Pirellulaceae bacterium]|nr:metallophosphoesterase [Pirellulaceae bacterium]